MLGKLVKGLSGLGGAAALTTGGMFLKNHVDRKNFLFNSDKKAREIEGDDGIVNLFKSNMDEEVVKRNWMKEVWEEAKKRDKGSQEELREAEEKTWKKITDKSIQRTHRQIDIEEEEIKKIEGEYQDYWRRYWEACMVWNLTRDGVNSAVGPICFVWYSLEEYQKSDEYKEYKKLKNDGLNMDVREFYWTIWRKFKNDKVHEIKKEDEADSNVPSLFASWKEESGNSKLFSPKKV